MKAGIAEVLSGSQRWCAVNGDCLDVLRDMPSASVDLVFCSPPYEAARTYGIDFALRGQAWVDWAAERFHECLRVSRGLVAWVVEGQTRQYRWSAAPVLLMADLHRRGVHLRKPPAFHRIGIPGSGGPDWLRNNYEFIVCATNGGKLPWSDNTAMGHAPKWGPGGEMSNRLSSGERVNQWGSDKGSTQTRRPCGKRQVPGRTSHVFGKQASSVGRRPDGSRKPPYFNGKGHPGMRAPNSTKNGDLAASRNVPFPVKANPGNVIRCNVGGNLMGSRLAHENEAPFPERLAEFFILSFCKPDGIVLDPFSGSGTTAAVAIKHGRRAIAIDVRASQTNLTEKRVAEVA